MMQCFRTYKTSFRNMKKDAVVVNAMREACHHNLYSIANSAGMNGMETGYCD